VTELPDAVRERLVKQLRWVLDRAALAEVGRPVVVVSMRRDDAQALLASLREAFDVEAGTVSDPDGMP